MYVWDSILKWCACFCVSNPFANHSSVPISARTLLMCHLNDSYLPASLDANIAQCQPFQIWRGLNFKKLPVNLILIRSSANETSRIWSLRSFHVYYVCILCDKITVFVCALEGKGREGHSTGNMQFKIKQIRNKIRVTRPIVEQIGHHRWFADQKTID